MHLAPYSSVQVMRASAYDLPFDSRFDIAFSIGVIHHLEMPGQALRRMAQAVKPGGRVLIWVYGREGNRWLVSVLNPLRRMLFSRMPIGLVHHLSLYPAALLWLLLRLGVRPLEYFRLLARFDFAHLRSIVFDQMLPRIAQYWPRETVARLLEEAGLQDVRIAPVNQMSWSAIGTRPRRDASDVEGEPLLDVKTLLGFAAMVSLTVAANLMLKLGAGAPRVERALLGVFGWQSAAGLALFGCAGLLYALLLRRVPLNLAQVFSAAQFLGVIMAASLVLGEPISPIRWLGIVCVCFGIVLVGLTARA